MDSSSSNKQEAAAIRDGEASPRNSPHKSGIPRKIPERRSTAIMNARNVPSASNKVEHTNSPGDTAKLEPKGLCDTLNKINSEMDAPSDNLKVLSCGTNTSSVRAQIGTQDSPTSTGKLRDQSLKLTPQQHKSPKAGENIGSVANELSIVEGTKEFMDGIGDTAVSKTKRASLISKENGVENTQMNSNGPKEIIVDQTPTYIKTSLKEEPFRSNVNGDSSKIELGNSPRPSRASTLRAANVFAPNSRRASFPPSHIAVLPLTSAVVHSPTSSRTLFRSSDPMLTTYNACFSPARSRPTSPLEKLYPSVPNRSHLSPIRKTSSSPTAHLGVSSLMKTSQKPSGSGNRKWFLAEAQMKTDVSLSCPKTNPNPLPLKEKAIIGSPRPKQSASVGSTSSLVKKTSLSPVKVSSALRNSKTSEVQASKQSPPKIVREKNIEVSKKNSDESEKKVEDQSGVKKDDTALQKVEPPIAPSNTSTETDVPSIKPNSPSKTNCLEPSVKSSVSKSSFKPTPRKAPAAIMNKKLANEISETKVTVLPVEEEKSCSKNVEESCIIRNAESEVKKLSKNKVANDTSLEDSKAAAEHVTSASSKSISTVSTKPLGPHRPKIVQGSPGKSHYGKAAVEQRSTLNVSAAKKSTSETSQKPIKDQISTVESLPNANEDGLKKVASEDKTISTITKGTNEKAMVKITNSLTKLKNDKHLKTIDSSKTEVQASLKTVEGQPKASDKTTEKSSSQEDSNKVDVATEEPLKVIHKSSSAKTLAESSSSPVITQNLILSTPKSTKSNKFSQIQSRIDTGRTMQRSGTITQRHSIQITPSAIQKPSTDTRSSTSNIKRTPSKTVQARTVSRFSITKANSTKVAQSKESSSSANQVQDSRINDTSIKRTPSKFMQRNATVTIQSSKSPNSIPKVQKTPQLSPKIPSSTSDKPVAKNFKGLILNKATLARMSLNQRQKSRLSLTSGAVPPIAPKSASSDNRLPSARTRQRFNEDILKKGGQRSLTPPTPKRSSSSGFLSSTKRFGGEIGPNLSARQKSTLESDLPSQRLSYRDRVTENKKLKVFQNLEKQLQILQSDFLTKYESLRLSSADKLKSSYKLVTLVRDEEFKLLINKQELIKITQNPSVSSINEFKMKIRQFLDENLNAFMDKLMSPSDISSDSEDQSLYIKQIREEMQKLTDSHLDGICQEIDNLTVPPFVMEKKLKNLEKQLEELRTRNDTLEIQIREMKQTYENENEAFQIALTEKAQEEISKKEMLIEDLNAKLEFIEKERNMEMNLRDDEMSMRQRNVVISLEAKIDAYVDDIASLKCQIRSVEMERDEEREENQNLSDRLDNYEHRYAALAKELEECKRIIKKHGELDNKYAEKLQKSAEEITSLREELTEAYQDMFKMQQSLTANEIDNAHFENLKREYEHCVDHIRELNDKLSVSKNENIETMRDENNILKDEITKLKFADKQKQADIDDLKLSLCKEIKNREVVEDSLHLKEEELSARLLLLKEMQASESNCRKQCQDLRVELQASKDAFLRQAAELKERSDELRKMNKVFRDRCMELSDQHHLVEALQGGNERHQLLRVRLEEKIAMLESEKRHLKETIDIYTKNISKQTALSKEPYTGTLNTSNWNRPIFAEPPVEGPPHQDFSVFSAYFEAVPAPRPISIDDEMQDLLENNDDIGLQEALARDFEPSMLRPRRRRSNQIIVRKYHH